MIMLAIITLTGGWEIIFYCMCIYIAVDLFKDIPMVLNKILDWWIRKKGD